MHDNIDKQRGIRETFLIPTFCLGFFVCCQEDLKTVFVGKKKEKEKKMYIWVKQQTMFKFSLIIRYVQFKMVYGQAIFLCRL